MDDIAHNESNRDAEHHTKRPRFSVGKHQHTEKYEQDTVSQNYLGPHLSEIGRQLRLALLVSRPVVTDQLCPLTHKFLDTVVDFDPMGDAWLGLADRAAPLAANSIYD
jgi:hypothetical protein